MTLLALKLLLAPGSIVVASLVARRFGVRVGGVVGSLPTIAGPILLVLALGHGRAFAADAAAGALLGMVALVVFVLVYVAVSSRFAWPVALLGGWASFGGVIVALRPVHLGALAAFGVACAATAATLVLLPRRHPEAASPRPHPRWDLPLRAVCAAIPVVAVTTAAGALGPHLSGLLATFPIITPVLAAFTHAQQGRGRQHSLHGMTAGYVGYGLFCFAVALGLEDLGIAASFVLATALALAAQAATIALARRHEQARPAEAAA